MCFMVATPYTRGGPLGWGCSLVPTQSRGQGCVNCPVQDSLGSSLSIGS